MAVREKSEARTPRTCRMTDTGYGFIERLADECGRTASEAMIALMSEALGDASVMRRVRTRLGKPLEPSTLA